MEGRNFWDLETWKRAHQLALAIYHITDTFPKHEQFGIISQMRRAASSVTANIAEGFERYHYNDKIRFYHQSRGSAAEVQNFLFLSIDLGYINKESSRNIWQEATEVRKMINGMIRSIEKQKQK